MKVCVFCGRNGNVNRYEDLRVCSLCDEEILSEVKELNQQGKTDTYPRVAFKKLRNPNQIVTSIEEYAEGMGWTKDPDGSYSTDNAVAITPALVKDGKLVIKFKEVNNTFSCAGMGLTTFEGFPEVVDTIVCHDNNIHSLDGFPEEVRVVKADDEILQLLEEQNPPSDADEWYRLLNSWTRLG